MGIVFACPCLALEANIFLFYFYSLEGSLNHNPEVAAYLAGDLEELSEDGYKEKSRSFRDILDGSHLDLTLAEKKELAKAPPNVVRASLGNR